MLSRCSCFSSEFSPQGEPLPGPGPFETQTRRLVSVQEGAHPKPPPRIAKCGFYFRKSDSQRLRRYRCLECRRTFSQATGSDTFGHKERRLNGKILELLCSGVSQRRIARLLEINPKTVARKLLFLARRAKAEHEAELWRRAQTETEEVEKKKKEEPGEESARFERVQFDELETFEHSKMLPVSVPLAVCSKTRRILGFQVASMPAKGLLAGPSRKKYGRRKDERKKALHGLLSSIAPVLSKPSCELLSDQCPRYPEAIRQVFGASPDRSVVHRTVKGQRGCVVGQGELKKIGFDPLFSLNHTCAMLRANINRLFRRTWCTTKRRDRLAAHLWIYLRYHNEVLLGAAAA